MFLRFVRGIPTIQTNQLLSADRQTVPSSQAATTMAVREKAGTTYGTSTSPVGVSLTKDPMIPIAWHASTSN